MKSHARVGARFVALAATATVAVLVGTAAQAAPTATPAPTRTTISATTVNVPYGGVAKLKAVVKPVVGSGQPGGTVTFSEGADVLGVVTLAPVNNVETAKLDVPGLDVGSHVVTARFSGSATFASSTSLPLTVKVGLPGTTTTVSATSKTLLPGADAKLKAVVKVKVAGTGTPSGTVTFNEGATELGTAPLALVGSAWTAKLTASGLSLGDHVITATYDGSATLATSTSKELTVTVAKGSVAITLVQTDAGGGAWKITAGLKAVAPATGGPKAPEIINFIVDGSAPQPVALSNFGQANLTTTPLEPGSHTVKVTYAGDSTWLAGSQTLTFTV